MKNKYILAALLCAVVGTASAKGDVTVRTEANAVSPDCVDIIVSMTNDENEVRGLECTFTLPSDLTPVGLPTYNEDRFDGFIPTLDVRANNEADNLSKVTFMSLGGDYVAGTQGEIFRFTVRVNEDADDISFTLYSEISYDNRRVDNDEDIVRIGAASPYKTYAMHTSIEIEDQATVSLGIDSDVPVGGFELVIELPEGLEFVTKSNGKVNWTFSSRVSKSKSDSEHRLADNKVKLIVIDAMSGALVPSGEGEVLSFNVKATEELALDSKIVISAIKVSNPAAKQFNQDGVIEITVSNAGRINVNEDVWAAIQADVEQVQWAIANFETIVATMQYASRYEGEEITGPVDAARAWVTATLEAYQAKYEAKSLTAEDGVKGDALEQVAAVYDALNLAAKYDVSRYVSAVVYAWAGDDDEIEGAKIGIMEIVASLPTAGQSALLEQIDMLEAAMGSLIEEYEAYVLYNEDAHAAIIKLSEDIMANISELVAAADEAAETEKARIAANLAAAEADVEKLEGYQAAITAAIKDNEKFISADTKQQIETLLGDTYMILIQQALDETAAGGEYESPINDEWWAQQIAAIKAEIAANKAAAEEAEAERVQANKKAYDADLSTLGRIQNKYNQTVTRILTLYAKYEDQEAELAVQDDIYALQDLCAAALEAVAKAGEYESPLTEEVLAKINAAIDKLLEDAKLRAESDGIIAVDGETDVTFYTLQGVKVQRPVRGQTYIVKSQTSVKKIVW